MRFRLLQLGTAVAVGDDAYLWFHLGSTEPFGHVPICRYCVAMAPFYRWGVRAVPRSDARAMSQWADQFSPGLGRFLESCGLFDDPEKGIALTWRQIKAFGTPAGPSACADIAGQDLAAMEERVNARLRAMP